METSHPPPRTISLHLPRGVQIWSGEDAKATVTGGPRGCEKAQIILIIFTVRYILNEQDVRPGVYWWFYSPKTLIKFFSICVLISLVIYILYFD